MRTDPPAPGRRLRDDDYVSAAAAGLILHISAKSVGRQARAGLIPHQRTMGGHRRYRVGDLRAIVAANTHQAGEEAADG